VKRLWIPSLVLVAAGLGYALYLANAAGEFRSVENRYPGACRAVAVGAGPEDVEFHPTRPYALVSSYDRRAASQGRPRPGGIYRLAPGGDPEVVNLTPGADGDFRPHGISIHAGADGRATLFVVNHPRWTRFGEPSGDSAGPAHTIEVFDFDGDALIHRRTLADPLLVSPNDIVALDHERFWVTNDHGTEPGAMRTLEDYLRLPWADVVYYDGETFRRAADGLTYANGIQLAADRERVWVSEVTRSRVREYARDPASGMLTELRRLDVGFGADNINLDPATGALWIAGHVKLLTFARHASDASEKAPSQVVRLNPDAGPDPVETVFLDDGGLLSGASAAAWRDGTLIIGAVFEPHVVICRGVE